MKIRALLFIAIQAITYQNTYSYAPNHFFKPYEIPTFLYEKNRQTMNAGFLVEGGSSCIGGDPEGRHVGVLQRYEREQSTLGLLKTRTTMADEATALLNTLLPDTLTEDDGALIFDGTYDQVNVTTWFSWKLPIDNTYGSFALNTYLPFTYQAIHNISFTDQTPNTVSSSSERVKQNITNDVPLFLEKYGSININDKKYGGLGDITCMLQWHRHFPQIRDHLINVFLHASLGTTIPTGIRRDCNNPFHLENGNNGAWGVIIKSGIDLGSTHDFHCGLDVDFLGLFFTTNSFRLKTDPTQTSFFIPEKGIATLAQGNSWDFGLFGKWDRILKSGFNAGLRYQFITHNEDELYPLESQFDFNVVNSNLQLEEWSAHYMMFSAGYDSAVYKDARVTCNASLFYKTPIIYKKSILMHSVGGQIQLRF
ncbi:hypothetical protein JKY79_03210 [Candidatus Babeliales bacterium]|nr:hypothetical protein [Candidatus Babeliales bacterium]